MIPTWTSIVKTKSRTGLSRVDWRARVDTRTQRHFAGHMEKKADLDELDACLGIVRMEIRPEDIVLGTLGPDTVLSFR